MTEVLEIPLITDNQDLAISFVNRLPIQTESIYNGFIFYTYPLNGNQKIFFYILDPFEESENAYIWDRIIPKAPFALMFFRWEDKIKNTDLERLYTQYSNRYETPLFFVTGNSSEEIDFSKVNDEILESHLENIVMYEPDNPDDAKRTLLNILRLFRETVEHKTEA